VSIWLDFKIEKEFEFKIQTKTQLDFIQASMLHNEVLFKHSNTRGVTLVQVESKFEVPRRNSIKFPPNSNPEASLNFHSKSTSNLKMFLWRKLFLSSKPSKPCFISNF
jgi:hypothetical protein